MGFEPMVRSRESLVFKTSSINHSDTSPQRSPSSARFILAQSVRDVKPNEQLFTRKPEKTAKSPLYSAIFTLSVVIILRVFSQIAVQPAEQTLQFGVAQAAGVGERRQHPAGIAAV